MPRAALLCRRAGAAPGCQVVLHAHRSQCRWQLLHPGLFRWQTRASIQRKPRATWRHLLQQAGLLYCQLAAPAQPQRFVRRELLAVQLLSRKAERTRVRSAFSAAIPWCYSYAPDINASRDSSASTVL